MFSKRYTCEGKNFHLGYILPHCRDRGGGGAAGAEAPPPPPPTFWMVKYILFYLTISITYKDNLHYILMSILRFSLTNQNGLLGLKPAPRALSL